MKFILVLILVSLSGTLCRKTTKSSYSDDEVNNFKCTELRDTIDSNIILHVPCTLLRLTEHLKRCLPNTYFDAFINIRCSEKCASGSLKKKFTRLKERLINKKKDAATESLIKVYKEQAKKLFTILEKSPANLTININQEFDCMSFGYSLRYYFEVFQLNHSIRALVSRPDDSVPIDEAKFDKKLENFRCVPEVKSDISFFHYLKYLAESFRFIATNDSTAKQELSMINVAQLFYPYVEMTSRFKRVLPGHSYLLYMLQNYEKLFTSNAPCDGQKENAKPEKKWKIGK